MSRKSTAPNTKKAAKCYISWLASLGVAESIHIAGSRSPLREKKHHRNSDWDIVLVTKVPNLKLVQPRVGDVLHGDLLILSPEQFKYHDKAAQVWPVDEHKIFKGVKL